jgi:hypothetical protein
LEEVMIQAIVFFVLAAASLGAYFANRTARKLGIDQDPINIAFKNATVNSLCVAALFAVLNLFVGG